MASHRNAYDHRLRELVCRARDLDLAGRLGVPRGTAKSWLRRGARSVVTVGALDADANQLRERVLHLERRNKTLLAVVRLLFVLVRMAGLRLARLWQFKRRSGDQSERFRSVLALEARKS
jgi:hypothetical protein